MSPGAKVFLTLAGVGTVLGVVLIAGAKNASAAPAKPKPQVPGSNAPPDIIVPPIVPVPPAQQQQPPAQPLPQLPQLPAQLPQLPQLPNIPIVPQQQQQPAQPNPQQQVPPGVTFNIPNPLGGAPLGTFDPATGNVFGPGGLVIGTFDPTTGIFTASTGQQLKIPNFPPGTPGGVVQPAAQQPAQQLPSLPSLPAQPPPPPPVQPPPAQQTTSPVSTVAADTAAMVATLLDAEAHAGWNKADPNVGVFQKARGLTVDSKFGPGTALKAALEIGTLPLIRFWPLGSTKAKLLNNYKQSLLELANASTDPVRANQLRLSASREDARAFSTKGALPALPSDMQVALAKVA
jgi:hypothetical protein